MHPLELTLIPSSTPKYLQLAQALRESIKSGLLQPNEKLCSAREFAIALKMNRHTVMNALAELVAEGWLVSQQRSGYRVNHALPIEQSRATAKAHAHKIHQFEFARPLPNQARLKITEYPYCFAGGLPDLTVFPYREFQRYLVKASQHTELASFHYGETDGASELKHQVSEYLRRARGIKYHANKQVMICNGSQEALFLIAKAFINPGDKVAVEALGYPPARAAFKECGANLVAIAQDSEGICIDDFERQLKLGGIKLVYLTPLHQYPTTVTLSIVRRMQLYRLACEYGVVIIEDDYDHEFHYACQPLVPMAADDPALRVIYLSTFSKLMFAGARIGYMYAASEVIAQLCGLKQIINHKNDIVMQQAVAFWMKDGAFERHLRRMTKLYHSRLTAMVAELQCYQALGYPIEFTIPDGGMALWVKVNRSVVGVKEALAAEGLYLQSEDEFVLGKVDEPTHLRLGFAGQDEHKMKAGLKLMMCYLFDYRSIPCIHNGV
ncbi:PLP-dependent aminotransferase family protein [Pseudoalteromonas tunicata]|uniref:MocR-like pyridoxine biosynthesis transcription factor PdxR n=1 Tax=Pseudoalteromonas tunicata TaxID=314281 RepID=UPI00273EC0FA|nr:PLP-dependent aminotransferase family protein [Pseudoalteromonas tunicata]MDP5212698.1 PLP-dependent aminotransferase family protein [Pseudoalteromonas tunicata]